MGAESFLTLQIVDFAEGVDDRVAALLQAGTGITLTYNDGAGTLTIASTVSPTWGSIGGTLSSQTDLQDALNAKMGGSTGATDNRILRADGTGGVTVQDSAVTIDDSGNISGMARLDSTRAGSMGSTNPQNQIIIYGGFAGYGIGFDANGELTTCVNSARRSTLGTHMNLGSSGQLRFNSAADLSGSWDTLVVRSSTGPTLETRSAGGLRVRNADGTAAAGLNVGTITLDNASGSPSISTFSNGGVTINGMDGNPGVVRSRDAILGTTGFLYWNARALMTSSANGVVHIQNYDQNDTLADQALAFGPATLASNGVRLKRAMASTTLQVRNGNDSAAGALDCGAITASGGISQDVAAGGEVITSSVGGATKAKLVTNTGSGVTRLELWSSYLGTPSLNWYAEVGSISGYGGFVSCPGGFMESANIGPSGFQYMSSVASSNYRQWQVVAGTRQKFNRGTTLEWYNADYRTDTNSSDLAVGRDSANTFGIYTDGTKATKGNLAVGAINCGAITASGLVNVGTYTVATLPSASANAGALAQVTDSSVTTNGSAVSGGGSNRVVVFSNGSNWDVVVA